MCSQHGSHNSSWWSQFGHTKSGFERKTAKSSFFFWLGGLEKNQVSFYKFFFPNGPKLDLGLHRDDPFHLAGVSRLFIFAERTLIFKKHSKMGSEIVLATRPVAGALLPAVISLRTLVLTALARILYVPMPCLEEG